MAKAIKWTNETRRLGELRPWAGNPRESTAHDAAAIVDSFNDFGQTHPLLISPDNELYDGHQRLGAWIAKFGADFEVDVRVSSRRLSDADRRKLVITLHAGATGRWNGDILSGWDPDELIINGFDDDYRIKLGAEWSMVSNLLDSEKAEPEFREYDESIADGVHVCQCPNCGHKHAAKKD